ncbi:hypothetical protein, partial [uncultured Bilophila sp.]|uniref:hypothetical protein n=1 Tax=uncultured Bilophila sp. TaxID=529385 RepID=UPI0026DC380E
PGTPSSLPPKTFDLIESLPPVSPQASGTALCRKNQQSSSPRRLEQGFNAPFFLKKNQNMLKEKTLSWDVVVSSPQFGENTAFFSSFSVGGLHGWSILSVIPLELQAIKPQPSPMTRPNKKPFSTKRAFFSRTPCKQGFDNVESL